MVTGAFVSLVLILKFLSKSVRFVTVSVNCALKLTIATSIPTNLEWNILLPDERGEDLRNERSDLICDLYSRFKALALATA